MLYAIGVWLDAHVAWVLVGVVVGLRIGYRLGIKDGKISGRQDERIEILLITLRERHIVPPPCPICGVQVGKCDAGLHS